MIQNKLMKMKLKKLTARPRLGSGNIKSLEQLVGHSFSEEFKIFMTENAGLSHYENTFTDKNGQNWEVSQYNQFRDLYGLTQEFKEKGWGLKVPFAHDPGGWHYCLSFDQESYGKIVVNRWTDHSPEEQFVIIADNFENFINNLRKMPGETGQP
jgi:hypothetical protein